MVAVRQKAFCVPFSTTISAHLLHPIISSEGQEKRAAYLYLVSAVYTANNYSRQISQLLPHAISLLWFYLKDNYQWGFGYSG